jgi:hypothetical protein
VGGPRIQHCGDARTWSKRQPGRCWKLQADKIVVCGAQAWTCDRASLFLPRALFTVQAGATGMVTRPAFRTP